MTMRIETKKLADLKPADWNPRKISDVALAGLRASIARFGLVEPIVFNERTGHIVGGHQRYKALLDTGEDDTQVVVVDIPETDEKALNVTLNNPAIMGQFTEELQVVLEELKVELPDDLYTGLRLEHIEVNPPDYDIQDEWKGMPECESSDKGPYRQLIISFASEEDIQAFSKLIEQKITPKTKSLWYPPAEIGRYADKRYIDPDEVGG